MGEECPHPVLRPTSPRGEEFPPVLNGPPLKPTMYL